MPKIAIVTDSVACIPKDLVKKYDIHIAPVQITWDRVTYKDGVDITAAEFYTRLRTSKTLPTTSSAIQGEFIRIYEGLKDKVDGIVSIVLSGKLGAAYASARTAQDIVGLMPPLEIVNTQTAMLAQAFIIVEATRVAQAGGSLKDVVDTTRETMPKVGVFWAMDTLEYLRRGGRVSLPQAIMASWLRVKPITSIEEGKVVPLAKVLSKTKAIQKLIDILEEKTAGSTKLHLGILHGNVPEEARQLENTLTSRFKYCELIKSEITPVIGTHTGPGAIGLAYYKE
jgi:DegV family protein with EDD domain